MEVLNAVVTAAATLSGVGLTLFFTNRRERSKFSQDLKVKELRDIEQFYVELVASIDNHVTLVKMRESNPGSMQDSLLTAKVSLFASEKVIDSFRIVRDALHEWETVFRQNAPKRLGNSDYVMITSETFQNSDEINAAYRRYFDKMVTFTLLIKSEIEIRRAILAK
jgi:hypothetical protein